MSNSEILVFGSFTEDETRSWLVKSSGNDEMTVDKQLGSLSFLTGRSLNTSSDGSISELGSSKEEPIGVNPPSLIKKDDALNCVKAANNILLKSSGFQIENGSIGSSIHCSPVKDAVNSSKVNAVDKPSTCSNGDASAMNQFSRLNLHAVEDGISKGRELNVGFDDSSVFVQSGGIQKTSYEHVTSSKNLWPRGLINSGNLCFLNATLQALLSCSPFVHLLQELRRQNIPKAGYPTVAAFAEFVTDFDSPSDSSTKNKEVTVYVTGRPFCPTMFEGVLKNFTPDVLNSISGRPRQEDAQEFLSFVMDKMHDELLKLEGRVSSINGGKSSLISSAEDDEWETVGKKNKSAVTRTQSFVPSKLSAIFGGELKSVVKASGNKASATIQPYLLLHLDILPDDVRTIEDALHLFSLAETVEGYRTSAMGKAAVVTAKKSVKIQTLSKIMILHLMRFGYGSQGSTKLHKPVRFPLELTVGRDLLVCPSTEGRRYELVATVTHHGREPSKGHYTADARYPPGQWLRFDDASVTTIGAGKVLHDQAYVLFYKQI